MPSPAFDTHTEIRKLQEAGCAEEQAEAMVDLVSRTPTDSRVLTRLDGVDRRLDGVDKRLDGIDTRLDRFESSVDVRFERLEGRVDVGFERLEGRMENLGDRMENLGDRVGAMVTETQFAQEFTKLYKHLLIGAVGICGVILAAVAAVISVVVSLS